MQKRQRFLWRIRPGKNEKSFDNVINAAAKSVIVDSVTLLC